MTFWRTQIGPHYDGDTRSSGSRCIGELVCPDCNNVMGRLFDDADGIAVSAWVPAKHNAPGDPNGQRVGWTFFTVIDASMPDGEEAFLACWRGHPSLSVTARDCRETAEAYRATGRKKRRPLNRVQPDDVR